MPDRTRVENLSVSYLDFQPGPAKMQNQNEAAWRGRKAHYYGIAMPTIDLNRRRILVVEDEPLLAMGIVDEIADHNGIPIGPVATLAQGIAALRDLAPDACILNIHLGQNLSYELADRLVECGIPFIFASSERRADIPDRFRNVPLHAKPIDMVKAAAGLVG